MYSSKTTTIVRHRNIRNMDGSKTTTIVVRKIRNHIIRSTYSSKTTTIVRKIHNSNIQIQIKTNGTSNIPTSKFHKVLVLLLLFIQVKRSRVMLMLLLSS
jgi:hypothetical protein